MTKKNEKLKFIQKHTAELFQSGNKLDQDFEFRVFYKAGRPQWLLEKKFHKPWHLETWPQTNLKTKISCWIFKLFPNLYFSLFSKLIKIRVSKGSLYSELKKKYKALGIFLGTPGPNSKLVIFAKSSDKDYFIKVPTSENSKSLITNEAMALSFMECDASLRDMTPRHGRIKDALILDDLRSTGSKFCLLDNNSIRDVHDRLFKQNNRVVHFKEHAKLWVFPNTSFKNNIKSKLYLKIMAAQNAVEYFVNTQKLRFHIECYNAHGDFTPWNVLQATDGTPKIIDWELYGLKPKYFDIFHYSISYEILVLKLSANKIFSNIMKMMYDLIDKKTIYFYFGCYLATQMSTYSLVYSVQDEQEEIHKQAYWQLEKWTELMNLIITSYTHNPEALE